MPNNLSYTILGSTFALFPLVVTVYLHFKTFWKYKMIILWVNIILTPIWLVSNELGYQQQLWYEPTNTMIGIKFGLTSLEDTIMAIFCFTIVSLVAILMAETYKKKVSFRSIYFKKE